jgi:hypothetical protein
MKYSTQQEDMLNKFVEFDRDSSNLKYRQAIKMLDSEPNNQQKPIKNKLRTHTNESANPHTG